MKVEFIKRILSGHLSISEAVHLRHIYCEFGENRHIHIGDIKRQVISKAITFWGMKRLKRKTHTSFLCPKAPEYPISYVPYLENELQTNKPIKLLQMEESPNMVLNKTPQARVTQLPYELLTILYKNIFLGVYQQEKH